MFGVFLVMCGGAIGAGLRFAMSYALSATPFPWSTLAVNLIGGLAMGLLAGSVDRATHMDVWLFGGVGILGGFTTFSAFSLESWRMLDQGQLGTMASYVMLSVVGSLAMTTLGFWIVRR